MIAKNGNVYYIWNVREFANMLVGAGINRSEAMTASWAYYKRRGAYEIVDVRPIS